MTRTVITNIGTIVSGDIEKGLLEGDTVVIDDAKLSFVGWMKDADVMGAESTVDARGTTLMPGLIDSHVHVVLGDYTPRQKTVDFIESYLHGGITSMISAGEIHAPGRPRDVAGVKALAVAAAKCFENYRPGGVKVHAGALIMEPGLTDDDFAEVSGNGVWLAKVGFGQVDSPYDYEPMVRSAQRHGIKVMAHTGGASIPGSIPINHEHLLYIRPDVCGHANGGTTALSDAGIEQLVRESDLILQIAQAGNLRSALKIVAMATELGQLRRLLIASDTPTGTGVMPLAVLKSIAELASLGSLRPEDAIAMATGNVADVYGLNTGKIEVGREADLVIADAPYGSYAPEALSAIAFGDIPGISMVLVDGELLANPSRNTPMATRAAVLAGA
jgi:enamidase